MRNYGSGLLVGLLLLVAFWSHALSCPAQTAPPGLPASVGEVVKLAQAHMTDDVILAYIKNANVSCSLSADQIIYLGGQGVSQAAIAAIMQGAAASAAPAPPVAAPAGPAALTPPIAPSAPTAPAAPAVVEAPSVAGAPAPVVVAAQPAANFDSFRTQLAPYGAWIQVEGYGWCWRPAEAALNAEWRPYCDRGYWTYTADGWFWQSEYPWGGVAFHYGRWYREPRYGWLWFPDYQWAPAWVCWRQTEGYCGWAALPPAARFQVGVGLTYNGRVGVDLDFGLRDEHFIFVGYDRFWEHDFRRYALPRERVALVFRGSHVMNGYRVAGGHLIVEGLGRDHIATLTHRKVEVVAVQHGGPRVEVRRDSGPRDQTNPPRDERPGTKPRAGDRNGLQDRGRHER